MKKTNNLVKAAIAALVVVLVCVLGAMTFYFISIQPITKQSDVVIFEVSTGDTIQSVSKKLENRKLIRSKDMAAICAKLNKLQNVKVGQFEIDPSWSVKKIFSVLNDSKYIISNDIRITFIEGDWAKDIARKLAGKTDVLEADLVSLWNDESYVRSIMETYPFLTEDIFNKDSRVLLEGYLFPETYNFSAETTAEKLTERLLSQTNKIYEKYKDQFNKSSLSTHEIFTLASIVQYEASKEEDMRLVASVFYNRLEKKMMLQSSVTVCYAIDKEKADNWQKCEVNSSFDSPYNTYKVLGLPPGPILNPGEMAIDAVLNPTKSEYLYFMADVLGDGTVYFSKTYAEHQALVNKYLR